MNKPCHDIATAKHIPMYFRLRNHHFVNVPGNSICTEDAATTKYMNGTAKRTEKPIIDDIPDAVDMSERIIAATIVMDMGIEISQNNLHLLMALFFSNAFRSRLIYCNICLPRELQHSVSSYTMTTFHGSIFWHVKFLENKDP